MELAEHELWERLIAATDRIATALEESNRRATERDGPHLEVVDQVIKGRPGVREVEDPNDLVKYVPLVSGHPFTGDGEGNDFCTHVTGYTEQKNSDDIPRAIPCGFPKDMHG